MNTQSMTFKDLAENTNTQSRSLESNATTHKAEKTHKR